MDYSSEIKIHFITEDGGSWGVAYLSSFVKSRFKNTTTTLNIIGEDIAASLNQIRPDIIGISSTSRSFIKCISIADEIKKRFDIPVVLGGVHLTLRPEELPGSVDVGVIGEGELTLEELLLNFGNGRFSNLNRIPGIVHRVNNRITINPPRPYIEDLDILPFPDLDLLRKKYNRYHPVIILTSRGCPYRCRFCASSVFWNRTRFHSPDYVTREMTHLVNKYHVEEILVYDDLFTADKKRVEAISASIARNPVLNKIRYGVLTRVDNFDEELAGLLQKMNVHDLSFGIESGCPKTLDYLKNKTLTIEQIRNALSIVKRYGMQKKASFIIGSPYETADEIRQTFKFISENNFDVLQITIATPFPGTALWDDGVKLGKISGNEWKDDYFTLFDITPEVNIRDLLNNKIFMTQIDRDVFLDLVEEGAEIQNRINYSRRYYIKRFLRKAVTALHLSILVAPYYALKRKRGQILE